MGHLLLKSAILELKTSHFLNVGGQPAVQLSQLLLLLGSAEERESFILMEHM